MKAQVYKDPRRPSISSASTRARAPSGPNWVYELVRMVLTPYLLLFYRARCIDSRQGARGRAR